MLKMFTFLTMADVADWLKIDQKKAGATGNKASKVIQDLTFTATQVGTDGNSIKVEYLVGGTAGYEEVTVGEDLKISVKIESGVSTAAQVLTALQANGAVNWLVVVTLTGTSSNPQAAASATALTGGSYDAAVDLRLKRVLEIIINTACRKIETRMNAPVIVREFQEDHDGNNSNVIKPHQWPIRAITELKIDYNRQFGDTTKLLAGNYFLRGPADVRQVKGDVSLQIMGDDIVLRDDNEQFILGRTFSGSVLGAIRIKYTAGWGSSIDTVPDDIKMAGLQLTEWLYYQRENRDLGVSSKGIKGESYSKLVDGMPKQIDELLVEYTDVSLGTHPSPQSNYFQV